VRGKRKEKSADEGKRNQSKAGLGHHEVREAILSLVCVCVRRPSQFFCSECKNL